MKDIKIISVDELHTTIYKFIDEKKVIIGEYEDMKECILTMIRGGYVFNMDRDRLRDAMEDLTYMLCPNDEINKDRVSKGLEYEYTDDEDEDDEDIYGSEEEFVVNKIQTVDANTEVNENVTAEVTEEVKAEVTEEVKAEEENQEIEDIGDIKDGKI